MTPTAESEPQTYDIEIDGGDVVRIEVATIDPLAGESAVVFLTIGNPDLMHPHGEPDIVLAPRLAIAIAQSLMLAATGAMQYDIAVFKQEFGIVA